MALKIRLRQQGRKNHHVFRLVLMDERSPRDGKYVEALGSYDPYSDQEEQRVQVKEDRIRHWLQHGAQFSPKAESLVASVAPEIIKERKAQQLAAREKARLKRKSRKAA